MKTPRNIIITGASSGLGTALAMEYAKTGNILHLQGRNAGRLNKISESCRVRGATVYPQIIDVVDAISMQNWIQFADSIAPLDLLIANAGISAGTGGNGESSEQIRKIFATNIDGVINSVQPIIPLMQKRKSGQIAIMSSLAGIRALPGSPAYSASKACIRYYGESIRSNLLKCGISVSVICPGYIKTPMTEVNNFYMPFIMSAEKAAKIISQRLARGQGRIAFPLALYLPLWFLSCLSPRITDPLFSCLPEKSSA